MLPSIHQNFTNPIIILKIRQIEFKNQLAQLNPKDDTKRIKRGFPITASTAPKQIIISIFSSYGNIKKLHGARSGEYGGCSNTYILCLTKNVILVKNIRLILLQLWSVSSYLLTENRQNFKVMTKIEFKTNWYNLFQIMSLKEKKRLGQFLSCH